MIDRARVWLSRAVLGLAAIWLGGLLIVFMLRVGFPLELEWMEGGVLHQALRWQQGESLYPPPSSDFVPFLYTPLYPILLSLLGEVFGVTLMLGRVISILAWIATSAAIARAVLREGRPRVHAAAAVGLWCAGYVFAFRWLDLARPDAVFMALTAWSLVLLRESWGDYRRAVAAGVLMALAFWTKQTAATFVLASGLGALVVAPRQAWAYALPIAVIAGGGVLWANGATEGRLWHYIYELHQAHAFNEERFTRKTWGMFVHAWPFIVALGALIVGAYLAPRLGARRKLSKDADDRGLAWLSARRGPIYWSLMLGTGMVVSALGYATQWAEPNAFIPGVCMIAIWVGVMLPQRGRMQVTGLALVAAQLVFALVVEPRYQPIQDDGPSGIGRSYTWHELSRTVPSSGERARAAELRDELEESPGLVFALNRPWWSVIAGGAGHVGSMGINDVADADRLEIQAAVLADLKAGRYQRLYFEGEPPKWLRSSLRGYRLDRRLQGRQRVRPMSGYMSVAGMVTPYRGDQVLMVPMRAREPPQGVDAIFDFEDGTLEGFEITRAAFGRRPVQGIQGRLPPAGPFGGEFMLSSAGVRGDLRLKGEATSPQFELRDAGALTMLLGAGGDRKGLSVAIVDSAGNEAEVAVPKTRFTLEVVRWEIEPPWNGAIVQLVLRDESPKGALFFDDLWQGP